MPRPRSQPDRMRHLAELLAVPMACAACHDEVSMPNANGPRSPTTVPAPAAPTAAPAVPPTASATPGEAVGPWGSVVFCGYGGLGVLPDNVHPDELMRTVAVVDLALPAGAAPRSARVTGIDLVDAGGTPLASMRQIIGVERVLAAPGKPSWAEALDTRGAAFDGTLGPGKTRLRLEAWLTQRPKALPQKARVTLESGAAMVVLEGGIAGEWPTG